MNSGILQTIVEPLNTFDVFYRSSIITPVILLDGNGSQLQLPFLEFIDDLSHPWAAIIGVSYGTSLWQVGDTEE